jgi:putative ABC transport system permease protein
VGAEHDAIPGAQAVAQSEIGCAAAPSKFCRGTIIVSTRGRTFAPAAAAAGLVGALFLTRYLSTRLFEVSRPDVATCAAVASLLLAVAVLACWIPGRRAMRVDPVIALRFE